MKRIAMVRNHQRWLAGVRRWRRAVARRGKRRTRELVRQTITPPPILSFADNFAGTTAFLEELRLATLRPEDASKRIHVYVDLVPVKRLSVPVAIVLAAEFHRWSLIKKVKLHPRSSSRWDPSVKNVLADLGVFDLIGSRPVSYGDGPMENITITPLESGLKFDGEKIDELQAHFADTLNGFMKKPVLFDGLMEAAENAIAHAYPPDYEPKHPFAGHRWWGASCYNLAENRLRFFIFDQGAGIPYTLPKWILWEKLLAILAKTTGGLVSDDAHMLAAAFEVGRTSTGLEHRGLGLKRMSDVVQGTETGYLRIISGKAEIIHRANQKIETRGLSAHIGGTLIEWNMPADIFTETPEGGSDADL